MRLARRTLPLPLPLLAVGLLAAGGVTSLAFGATDAAKLVTTQSTTDAKADVRSTLDLTTFSFARGSDGRLRANVTLAAAWDGKDLLSETGLPGSVCVKAWTTSAPPDTTPDYLICTTAEADGTLRGSILKARANKLPERTGGADVTRPSKRSVTLRFSQTALGKPATLYVQAEATRPGCPRGSCIDLAPDAPKTLKLTLRETTAK
jgi:hypothetical protein